MSETWPKKIVSADLTGIHTVNDFGPAHWGQLINFAPDFIFISRIATFEIIEISQRACDYYGYTRKEFLGMLLFDIEMNASLFSTLQDLYKTTPIDEVFELFGHNRRKDGTVFAAHTRITKIDEEYAMSCVRDITFIEDQANLEIHGNRLISKDMGRVIKYHKLSPRESEVLVLIGKAMSNLEIAEHLKINIKTVSTYRARLLQKLKLKNNTELAQYAIKV